MQSERSGKQTPTWPHSGKVVSGKPTEQPPSGLLKCRHLPHSRGSVRPHSAFSLLNILDEGL